MSDNPSEEVVANDQPQASLSVNDIMNAVKIIDYACDQGAFKGWSTLENVARVRARLLAFIQMTAPNLLQPEQVSTETTETLETPETDAPLAEAA